METTLNQASPVAQQIIRRFGQEVRIPMRQCDDVPRYVQKIEDAHQQTAHSTLHFGPTIPAKLK